MTFDADLESGGKTAESEREVLAFLAEVIGREVSLDKSQVRAARASLQILIDNAIGKARRILKHYNCPVIPTRSRDPFIIMHDIGLIGDETYQALMQAVGFRNAMIHDYMNFDVGVLVGIVGEKRYLDVYDFLMETPKYSEVLRKRIENFAV